MTRKVKAAKRSEGGRKVKGHRAASAARSAHMEKLIVAARAWAAAERALRDVNYHRHFPDEEAWHQITLSADVTEEHLLAAVAAAFPEDDPRRASRTEGERP
jgi:hypothetical protein